MSRFSGVQSLFARSYSVRASVIQSYRHKWSPLTHQSFQPTSISTNQFINSLKKWLCYANTPYLEMRPHLKRSHGLFYPEDYYPEQEFMSLIGLANPNFWDITYGKFLFKAKEQHAPASALNAFFDGPTIAESASVLQACVWKSIEEMIGTTEFNRVVGSSLTRLLITPSLFTPISSIYEKPELSLDDRITQGNPLYFLFENLGNANQGTITEKDIKEGDILYIRGVKKFLHKHLFGSGIGLHVICVGKNAQGENLYLGFGPETFNQPLTYQAIKLVLIKYYNSNQSFDTEKQLSRARSSGNADSFEAVAIGLSHDKVEEDHPIGGIQDVIQFNPEKLEHWVQQKFYVWYEDSPAADEKFESKLAKGSVEYLLTADSSVETRNQTFANYQVTTVEQSKMLSVAQKFAFAVCDNKKGPLGLVMTGMPGIGKSHLSAAIIKYVAEHGLNVLYATGQMLDNWSQKVAEQDYDDPRMRTGINFDLSIGNWWKLDLIVMDNIEIFSHDSFLQKAFQYVMQNNKALIVIGAQPLNFIFKNLADYIGYQDSSKNNFLSLQNLEGVSYRQKWWSTAKICSSSGALTTNQDALEILANVSGGQAAGIVLEQKNPDLKEIAQKYIELSPDKNIRIRILAEPYKNNRVFDMYVRDCDQHDVFIVEANDTHQTEQMLNLIAQAYDLGKKIIVITADEAKLNEEVNIRLQVFTFSDFRPILSDRLKNMLFQKSDWPDVTPTILPKKDSLSVSASQSLITTGPRLPARTFASDLIRSSLFSVEDIILGSGDRRTVILSQGSAEGAEPCGDQEAIEQLLPAMRCEISLKR